MLKLAPKKPTFARPLLGRKSGGLGKEGATEDTLL